MKAKIQGTDDLRDLAKRLKAAGDKKTLNALRKGIREAAQPAVTDVANTVSSLDINGVPQPERVRGAGKAAPRSGAAGRGAAVRLGYDVLKSRGNLARVIERAVGRSGLRDTVARALTTQVAASGRSASVRIKVDQGKLPEDQRKLPYWMEKGAWRHPIFGNRDRWAAQESTPDWFAGTIRRHRDDVRESIRAQVKEVTDSL